ncbi:MAG TPA: RDD family protein [Bacillota bacterium]|nr:RDD family protein [Bacillota bacterium]
MKCPACESEIQEKYACGRCGVLLANPGAGVIASPGRRLGGYILDFAVIAGFYAVTMLAVTGSGDEGLLLIGVLLMVAGVVGSFILLARGRSYGKWLLGMRTYRVTGRPAGFWTMLFRETIGKFVSGIVLSLGYLWLLWDREHQAWHDKIAGTVVLVVRKRVDGVVR